MIIYILAEFLWHFLFATLGAYIGSWFVGEDKPKHKQKLIIGFLVGLFMTFLYLFINNKI
jgi:membrane protein DedA with SNARE-associated domain